MIPFLTKSVICRKKKCFKQMPAISVIIPAYNHEQYIEQTLNSVFSQTFTDYEIIVVNDGSPDCTADRIKPYLSKKNVRYFEKKNGGQAAARNFGLRKAKGKYIAFLDDDDLWPADKLEWQFRYLSGSDLAAVGGCCGFLEDGIKKTGKLSDQEEFLEHSDFYHGNPFISPGQVLIKAGPLHKAGGFDSKIWGADDLDLWMRLSVEGKILKIPRNSLWYRKHSANASKNRIRMLENSKKVILKNARRLEKSEKRKMERNGYRWLYRYAGRELVIECKSLLKSLKFISFTKKIFRFTKAFFPKALLDAQLVRAIGKDWIPNRLKDKFFEKDRKPV